MPAIGARIEDPQRRAVGVDIGRGVARALRAALDGVARDGACGELIPLVGFPAEGMDHRILAGLRHSELGDEGGDVEDDEGPGHVGLRHALACPFVVKRQDHGYLFASAP